MLLALLKDIMDAMKESLKEGKGTGAWRCEEKKISVTTFFSRDPSRSNNGGEYYYYREFFLVEGGIIARDDWSCDFASYSSYGGSENFYPSSIQNIGRVGHLAEARVLSKI